MTMKSGNNTVPSSHHRPELRNHTSSGSSGPDRLSHSTSSIVSSSSSRKLNSSKNAVLIAVRSVAGAFVGCFTPPEKENSGNFDSYKQDSAKSDGLSGEKRRGGNRGNNTSSYNSINSEEPRNVKFTLQEIYRATKNFSPSLKIGQGGFGTVYKGQLDDGKVVAIKRAKKSTYDKHAGIEFRSEVQTLEKVEHLNLVKLYGYLEQEDERIVVVEYVSNGTLREHLDCMLGVVLDFSARLDIAVDVAHAVTYLHMYTDRPIIHRDIKSSNILLTETFRAKVADFGFARLVTESESGATHVSTQVKGTAGYLDPEYLKTYQLTEKSDVYSFGVLLVELVTGRRPIEPKRDLKERITARWAMKKFKAGEAVLILDTKLDRSAANNLAIEKILELALSCLSSDRPNRPAMRKCAEILWSIRKDYRKNILSEHLSASEQ